jgi:DMSO reductase anchor subunit
MRPAASLIIFTTLSGLGFGLATLIGFGLITATSPEWVMVHGVISLGLIGAGVISSTVHLGHPERAWRALSQWRSSWLSREGVLAALTVGVLAIYFADHLYHGAPRVWLGVIVGVLSLLTVISTAMIYASLKTVARWHHALTPVVFVLLSLAGGVVLAAALSALEGMDGTVALTRMGLIAVVLAMIVKTLWWLTAGVSGSGSTPETATGLGALGEVRMLMPPHSEENWLQHEMGFHIARKHSHKLAWIALILGAGVPILIMGLYPSSATLLVVAALVHLVGVMVERWLFFAEAKHTVTLYYGARH